MRTSDILKTTCWSIGLTKSKDPATFSIIQLISGLVLLFHIHANGGWVGDKTRYLETNTANTLCRQVSVNLSLSTEPVKGVHPIPSSHSMAPAPHLEDHILCG